MNVFWCMCFATILAVQQKKLAAPEKLRKNGVRLYPLRDCERGGANTTDRPATDPNLPQSAPRNPKERAVEIAKNGRNRYFPEFERKIRMVT